MDIWRWRNLTLEGKVLIVKTFGLSQLIYSLQSTVIKHEDLSKVENIIYRFIWNIKKDNPISSGKIRREILKQQHENGGLKSPDIFHIDRAIKYKNLLRNLFHKDHVHPIKLVCSNALNKYGFDWNSYKATCSRHNLANTFYGVGISTHIEIGKNLCEDIKEIHEDDGIHRNYYAFVQNINLFRNGYVNIHQNHMIQRLLIHNITNLRELNNERRNPRFGNLFLDVYQIYNSFPIEWRNLLNKTERIHPQIKEELPLDVNKWVSVTQVTVKLIVNSLMRLKNSLMPIDYILDRHKAGMCKELIAVNPFLTLRKTSKDVKIRNLQYKLLHNIYPTMKHLQKWKIKQTNLCGLCATEETLKHAIYECPVAQTSLGHLETILQIPRLSYESVLLGPNSTVQEISNHNQKQITSLETILILLKQKLILQRENKVFLTITNIRDLILARMSMEKYNSIKTNKISQYTSKWGWIERIAEI